MNCMKPVSLTLIALMTLGGLGTAHGQAYKCTVNGAVVFQQGPCAEGGVKLAVTAPSPRDVQVETLIAQRKVAVSMTAAQVKRSWGPPTKVNKTISASSTSEQWVYDRGSVGSTQYVYLTDGIVSSIQSPSSP